MPSNFTLNRLNLTLSGQFVTLQMFIMPKTLVAHVAFKLPFDSTFVFHVSSEMGFLFVGMSALHATESTIVSKEKQYI